MTHCGSCTESCNTTEVCGATGCTCPSGTNYCTSQCFDFETDHENCGGCGRTCGSAETCSGGVCSCANPNTLWYSTTFDMFSGSGYAPGMGTPARLDSNSWIIDSISGSSVAFGGTEVSAPFARGVTSSPPTQSGVYAGQITTGNRAYVVQPDPQTWNPGSTVLRIKNNGTSTYSSVRVKFSWVYLNHTLRTMNFRFMYSDSNEVSYQLAASIDTPTFADTNGWAVIPEERKLAVDVAPNEYLYLKWRGQPSGTGLLSDLIGIDDVFVYTCGP